MRRILAALLALFASQAHAQITTDPIGGSTLQTPSLIIQQVLAVGGQVQIGGLPFVQADTYSAGSTNSLLLAVRGTSASPITDSQAVAIFQAVRNQASATPAPTLYASVIRQSTNASFVAQGALFEAVDAAGVGATNGAYAISACATAGTGNCEGMLAGASVSVSMYSTIIGGEGNAISTNGVTQTTTFSSSKFLAGLMATCGGANNCDAGFIINPTGSQTSKAVTGFYVPAGVSDSAFRNDASLVNGVDLSRGTYSGSAYKSPGFAVDGSGNVTANNLTTAWTAFTPSPVCGNATFTVNSARARTIGKTTFIQADITIATIGTTCNGMATINWTIPNTPQSPASFIGRNNNANTSASSCEVISGTATAFCALVTGAQTWATNDRFLWSGVYENQ